MRSIFILLLLFLLGSCTGSKELNSNEIGGDSTNNRVIFDCLGSSETIYDHEYFRLSMPCICEIVDSVKIGSDKHIGYVVNWIKNVRIEETHDRGYFICINKEDKGGTKSYLRGHEIFEALLSRISSTENGFQCPDDPDATGFNFPTASLCRILFKMVLTVDNIEVERFISEESPSLMTLINADLDYRCTGNFTKPVFNKLKDNYYNGKVILKPFDKR